MSQISAMLPTYSNQVAETQMRLAEWHEQTAKRLKIDMVETMIQIQSEGKQVTHEHDKSDLYSEDVQLIIKDDKIYYLPANESDI